MKINNNARPWDKIDSESSESDAPLDNHADSSDIIHEGASDTDQNPSLSDDEFGKIGLKHIAYVRLDQNAPYDDAQTINIFAADGSTLGQATSIDQAHGLILQNNMIPVAVH